MKKVVLILFSLLILTSLISAEIIITQEPNSFYNMGDIVNIPVKIISAVDVNNFFELNLLCNGIETTIYKEYVSITAGDEKVMSPLIPLVKSLTERSTGSCKIKAILGEEFTLTNEFEISDTVTIEVKSEAATFNPAEDITIEGEALKENTGGVNGIIEITLIGPDATEAFSFTDTVKNGYFFVNLSLPENSKAGEYTANMKVYEIDFENEITNQGLAGYSFTLNQVPTSLEIIYEEQDIEPGTTLQVKSILHDQTGEPMEAPSYITIKDDQESIILQEEKPTNEFLEYAIAYNEKPAEWTVVAVSNKLTTESTFTILEKMSVDVQIINKSLTITNNGNVPYNDSVAVKIGNETISLDVQLKIDGEKKYALSAPDGEYEIAISTNDGHSITGMAVLTGRTIEIKEMTMAGRIAKHPFVWFFVIGIMGFMAFMVFRKGYKKTFFGYISKIRKKKKAEPIAKDSLVNSTSKAEISLSIKGDKQDTSLICLKIKNLKEIQSKQSNAEETLQKIVNIAESNKASTYENHDNLFFILAPIKTKTFSNEKVAIKIAEYIERLLKDHNKLAKQKIEFGVSINNGTIIAKQEGNLMKFMSMGTLITSAKKMAAFSKGEILLGKKMKDKLGSTVKTEKEEKEGLEFYTIKEIKNKRPEDIKFISNFVKKLEGDKKK
jgi:hypothetical protein